MSPTAHSAGSWRLHARGDDGAIGATTRLEKDAGQRAVLPRWPHCVRFVSHEYRFVVDDRLAVELHGHVSADERDIERLPLTSRFLSRLRCRDAPVDRATW